MPARFAMDKDAAGNYLAVCRACRAAKEGLGSARKSDSIFRNLADVRAAVAGFVERYNQCWLLEKLAYRTPLEARQEHELRQAG